MGTVIYSANSHRKIVHLSHCKIIRRIPKESRRTFDNLEEARKHGYHLCKCCPSIAQKYRKERRAVSDFCRATGMTFKLQDGVIHVISDHDCWRIIVHGSSKTLFLYHKNTERRFCTEKYPSIIPGFHSQPFRSDTILGYLQYIETHDRYRDEHPCTEHAISSQKNAKAVPDWFPDKYGPEYLSLSKPHYKRIKGTKRYKKDQARKKRQERRAGIIRVKALLDELAELDQ